MADLIWLGLRAFVFALILTPIVRDIFCIYHIVDQPDSSRKLHPYPIPRVGGIAIAVSYLLASYFMPVSPGEHISLVKRLLPSMTVIFTIGLIDDFVGLKPWQKLTGQTVAAAMAYLTGVRVLFVAGHAVQEWSSFLVTIVWLLACTNAFNLVDGLDGLAAGIGFFSTLTIFVGAIAQNRAELTVATLPLAGCLVAFLCYNFSPATIFLGDCGSLLIGFLLGCYGAIWTDKSLTLLGMLAPAMAFSLPLLDVVLSVLRRFLRSKPLFGADRGHIHHRLIDRGLSPRRVVLIIYGICGIGAAFALVQSLTRNRYLAFLVTVLFVFVIWAGIRFLGYTEFAVAGRALRIDTLQGFLGGELALENFTADLLAANSPDACWAAIQQHYANLGFKAARLQMEGVVYRDWGLEVMEPKFWTVRIPFAANGFVELARDFRNEGAHSTIAPLANLLHRALPERMKGKQAQLNAHATRAS